jgi:hypothetical protein
MVCSCEIWEAAIVVMGFCFRLHSGEDSSDLRGRFAVFFLIHTYGVSVIVYLTSRSFGPTSVYVLSRLLQRHLLAREAVALGIFIYHVCAPLSLVLRKNFYWLLVVAMKFILVTVVGNITGKRQTIVCGSELPSRHPFLHRYFRRCYRRRWKNFQSAESSKSLLMDSILRLLRWQA